MKATKGWHSVFIRKYDDNSHGPTNFDDCIAKLLSNRHAILIRIRESVTEFTIQETMSCTLSGKVDLHMQTALKPVEQN